MNKVLSAEGSLSTPVVESSEVDNDFNGKNDFLEFSTTFTLNAGETVTSANAYLFFNYKLKLFSRVEVLGMAVVQEQTEIGSNKLSISGDLDFNQKINLPHKGSLFKLNFNIAKCYLKQTHTTIFLKLSNNIT